ncbi:MAG: isochorismatase family cysteine hydrolase [Sporolactobacillus sp.]
MTDNHGKALLVIDVQEDPTGDRSAHAYDHSKRLIEKVNDAIERSQSSGIEIIYVKHELADCWFNRLLMHSTFIKGSEGSEINKNIKRVSQHVFCKHRGNALTNPELYQCLQNKKVSQLFLIGLDASACVYRTALGAMKKGYKTTVLQDAVITRKMDKLPGILERYKKRGITLDVVQNLH